MTLADDLRAAASVAETLLTENAVLRDAVAGGADEIARLEADLAECRADSAPAELVSGLLTAFARPPFPWMGYVPAIHWRTLEPSPGVYDLSLLDTLLAGPFPFRARLMVGRYSPAWVMQRHGSVTVTDSYDGITATVPRWWRAGFLEDYAALQAALAAHCDGDLSAIFVVAPMTIHGEPFLRGAGGSEGASTRAALVAAGHTLEADKASFHTAIEAHRVWKRTRQGLAFNPFQAISSPTSWTNDTAFPIEVMERLRAEFGERAILQNNSIREGWLANPPAHYRPLYDAFVRLGPPFGWQTASFVIDPFTGRPRVGDLETVVRWCAAEGASAVEVPAGFQTHASGFGDATARELDELLKANATS